MSAGLKIAIIEDDPAIAHIYRFKLEHEGYVVRVAHNAKDGLQLVQAFIPDLLLLDLRMPGMGGDEMLERLRSTEWGSNIRVIILTNISKDEAPAGLRLLNVDRYIVKAHHTPNQVLQIINDVMGN